MGPVLVFGHRAPDNDSIASAVAYAHLKNVTDPGRVYAPVCLGPVPPETAVVFERFSLSVPPQIAHVRTRVCDAMTTDVVSVYAQDNVLSAGRLMREHSVRSLPVVGDDDVVLGLVNHAILAELYLREIEMPGLAHLPMTVAQLASVLEGRLLTGDPDAHLAGQVLIGAMEPETMLERIAPGDVLIVGDRRRAQPLALEAGVACLIVTGDCMPDAAVLSQARSRCSAVIVTPHDTYAAARLVHLGRPVSSVMDTQPLIVESEALLADVAEDLMDSPHREAIVVDGHGRLVGILTRTNLARPARRPVVLVDHNERSQSAEGIDEAQVLEIVDHHRVGDIETPAPILFLNLPVGSTATIVAERYRELEVPLPNGIAGALLSAILTDTVLLKSPTTTETDRAQAARLAERLGVDLMAFGRELFAARTAGTGFDASAAVSVDLKEYRTATKAIGVAQIEVVDPGEYLERAQEMIEALDAMREKRGFDLAVLLVTDIVAEGSYLFATGQTKIAEQAFGAACTGRPVWMPGVLSRKKQVAAPLLEAAKG